MNMASDVLNQFTVQIDGKSHVVRVDETYVSASCSCQKKDPLRQYVCEHCVAIAEINAFLSPYLTDVADRVKATRTSDYLKNKLTPGKFYLVQFC